MGEAEGEGSANQQADREWAPQSEEAADMAGDPRKAFLLATSTVKWVPWNLSGTAVMSWFFR